MSRPGDLDYPQGSRPSTAFQSALYAAGSEASLSCDLLKVARQATVSMTLARLTAALVRYTPSPTTSAAVIGRTVADRRNNARCGLIGGTTLHWMHRDESWQTRHRYGAAEVESFGHEGEPSAPAWPLSTARSRHCVVTSRRVVVTCAQR